MDIKVYWWLKQIQMQTLSGQEAFSNLIRSYEYHREQILTLKPADQGQNP